MKFSFIDCLIYRLTARRWNRLICSILLRHYGLSAEWTSRLSSEQLHKLCAEFDPTQKARWTNIRPDGSLVFPEDVTTEGSSFPTNRHAV
jgi:hypothetical protein